MLIVTTDSICRKYEPIGIVEGGAIQCTLDNRGKQKRKDALAIMESAARSIGADAVIAVRFNTVSSSQGIVETYVYGTAVRYIKD